MALLDRARDWARRIKRDVVAVWYAARDPDTPPAVRLLALMVAAYALSPIDLIPDFVPVLGYLDDVILLPLGILLVVALIPRPVMDDLRRQAAARLDAKLPRSTTAAVVIVALWCLIAAAVAVAVFDALRST
jgi:uncharacterized membrane protein YkvA (DUF1232 family)